MMHRKKGVGAPGTTQRPGVAAAGHGPGLSHGAEVNAADPASLDLRFSKGQQAQTKLKLTCVPEANPHGTEGFLRNFGGPSGHPKKAS